jgi:hypothetical protein
MFRSDGTLAYFFSTEVMGRLCSEAGFKEEYCKYVCVINKNRKSGQEMKRVFIQGRFSKPDDLNHR